MAAVKHPKVIAGAFVWREMRIMMRRFRGGNSYSLDDYEGRESVAEDEFRVSDGWLARCNREAPVNAQVYRQTRTLPALILDSTLEENNGRT